MGRRLGQHFLTSRAVLARILRVSHITKRDTILEVGPGKGVLTKALLEQGHTVIAVEKDARLYALLKDEFATEHRLHLVHGDILSLAIGRVGDTDAHDLALPDTYSIVANIPYYITSRFLRIFLEETNPRPTRMTLLIQKEVGERITARPPHMNMLALSVQAYGRATMHGRVAPGSFSPPPEVDSTILTIESISDDFFTRNTISPQDFFANPKKAFSQKRKMLRRSLGIEGSLSSKRPEELSLEDWISIAAHKQSHNKAQKKPRI